MKLLAEIDVILGILVGTGRRRLGFGFRIQRKKVVKRIGVDLGEKRVKRFRLFLLRNADVKTWNWKSIRKNIVSIGRERAMKRGNVFSLLLQMMPSSLHATSTSPKHWEFLEDIDAPQWADLAKESSLLEVQGDHPWFHATHSHHEVSLARVEPFPVDVMEKVVEKPQQIIKKKVELGKGTVAKLLKPSFKANNVKACLGGTQRVSNAGSTDGRLSSRLRLTNQARPRTPKKIRLSRSGSLIARPAQAGPGRSDPRPEASRREMNARKGAKDPEAKKLQLMETSVKGKKEQTMGSSRIGPNSPMSGKLVAHPIIESGRTERHSELCDSQRSSAPMYRLPSPPEGTTSSPSDMVFSSGGSRKSSTSSNESRNPPPRTSTSRRKLIPERAANHVEPESNKGPAQELPPAPFSKVVIEFREPSVDPLAVSKLHQRVLQNERKNDSDRKTPDRKQRASSPRSKRRSIGSPLRVKPIERAASFSAKKKVAASADLQDVGKESAPQASHPILEKLRKSWGSALRAKQKQEKPSATKLSPLDDRQSSEATSDRAEAVNVDDDLNNLQRDKAQGSGLQSSPPRREQSEGAAIRFTEEVMSRNSSVRSEMMIPFEDTLTSTNSPARKSGNTSKAAGLVRKSTASDTSVGKVSTSSTTKAGLGKVHPNQQRIRPDGGSKFKKQYAFPETGVSKTLRANKENMELRYKLHSSPPHSERSRTPQIVGTRSVITKQVRPAVSAPAGIHQVPRLSTQQQAPRLSTQQQAPRPSTYARTAPQPGPLSTSKTTNLPSRLARPAGSAVSAVTSGQKLDLADAKVSNSGSNRAIGASAAKPAKQKGEAFATWAKESIPNAGPKGCKNGGRVADESVAVQSHKAKIAAAKSQPATTTHNVKSIREWEMKSGRRYHDLQPNERQRINQQIIAASKAMAKRPTA